MANKKILIIYYDPNLPESFLSSLRAGSDIEFILASGLSEGAGMLSENKVSGIIIEYPVAMAPEVFQEFLSRPTLEKMPIMLIASEKKFLDNFGGLNISKFSQDEIESKLIPAI